MNEFTSKELKRTFRSIFFVHDFTDQPITTTSAETPQQMPASSMAGKQPVSEYTGIVVPKADGGITIAELYEKKNAFEGIVALNKDIGAGYFYDILLER